MDKETRSALTQTGLQYADTSKAGLTRKGAGRGFAFYYTNGKLIRPSDTLNRIKALAIPPAWKDVWVAPKPDFHIQATGQDEAGRKQYIYHSDWADARIRMNFARMQSFGEALPNLRAAVYRRLKQPEPNQQTVIAAVVRLLDTTLIRVGNLAYAKDNDSFGLTTLERSHVSREQSELHFAFTGKSGVKRELSIHDALLAELVGQLEEGDGDRLFQYRSATDNWQPVTASAINKFLLQHAGDFTAKDFRPWGGSVTLADALNQFTDQSKPIKGHVDSAAKLAADRLGNTVSVAKTHYLHPAIGEAYLSGNLARHFSRGREQAKDNNRLKIAEGAVLSILRAT